jgi:hypothetical protein
MTKSFFLRPGNHQTWLKRGLILERLGYVQEAVSSYKIVLEIKPDYHEAIERKKRLELTV